MDYVIEHRLRLLDALNRGDESSIFENRFGKRFLFRDGILFEVGYDDIQRESKKTFNELNHEYYRFL